MKKIDKDVWLLIGLFIISRIILSFFGIRFQYDALFKYWQYLDVETLKHNLIRGVWFDHAQPPFVNIFLGLILQIFGDASKDVFSIILKLISLSNSILILTLLKRILGESKVPIVVAIIYLLSPASMILENELFYTTFISFGLLISSIYLLKLQIDITWSRSIGFVLPLVIVCLSRSMYHLLWLLIIAIGVIIFYRKRNALKKLITITVAGTLLVTSWYVKNYFVFGKFTTSSWIGMNLARNVFHYEKDEDSNSIASIQPFSKISFYHPFISGAYEKKFSGKNDRDLLSEFKNGSDTLINLNHISYLEVSDKYFQVSKSEIKAHPVSYIKNVAQSAIIFFAPATRYPWAEAQAKKIFIYDAVYSFNLSNFASDRTQRRITLTISSIPKMFVYFLVLLFLFKEMFRDKRLDVFYFFIFTTILYVFGVSSLIEHYENMRFRFEVEPLFLVALGLYVFSYLRKKKFSNSLN